MSPVSAIPKTLLITGASSGIGEACARWSAARGWRVLATARQPSDLGSLARVQGIQIHDLDVTQEASVAALQPWIQAVAPEGLGGLVNNAGIAVPGPLEILNSDELQHQLEVNVLGVHRVTQALLPALRQGQGKVINISSMAGRVAGPMLGAYHASKWALEGMTEAWRRETLAQGVDFVLVEPGAIQSRIWDKGPPTSDTSLGDHPESAQYRSLVPWMMRQVQLAKNRALPAEAVARVVHHSLISSKPKARILVGKDAKLAVRLARYLPTRWLDRQIAKSIRRGS